MRERFRSPLRVSSAPMGGKGELLGLGSFRLKVTTTKQRVLLLCCVGLAACARDPAELILQG